MVFKISLRLIKNKLVNILWPLKKSELSKFFPIAALMFCILFSQNILRILKDSILIIEISAEVTSFVKLYCVTPVAALFVILYAKLVNHLSFEKIFRYLSLGFTVFFLLFAFILYPNIDFFHLDKKVVAYLMDNYPYLKWHISLIGNWSYVLFYVMAEIWPNVFYVLLFWQLANEVTNTEEAKRFYTLFSLFGNSSLIFVGLIVMYLALDKNLGDAYISNKTNKILFAQITVVFVAIASLLSCMLVTYITKKNIIKYNNQKLKYLVSQKNSMGILKSFKYITKSKYLWIMLLCSASFGLAMNLVESVWKSKIKELYPTVKEYAAFNSIYILWTGIVIMIMTIIGNNIIRSKNWFIAVLIVPLIIFISGVIFFLLVVWDNEIVTYFSFFNLVSPLVFTVVVGTIQNVLSKGSKYSIWDTSIQMLYIPLNQELRTKGKAAVDIISPKIGKSASGFILSIIFTIFPRATYQSISLSLMIIFVIVCIIWIFATQKIYLEYKKMF